MRSRLAFLAKSAALLTHACCVLAFLCFCANVAGPAKPVDRILIEKSKRTMSLMSGTEILKSYKFALGGKPVGAKERQGDHKTPEAMYAVDVKIPNSQFHKALRISYPNSIDRERARMLAGDMEIHGLVEHWGWTGTLHRLMDWTDGCIAVTDDEIDEIYPLVRIGTVVETCP